MKEETRFFHPSSFIPHPFPEAAWDRMYPHNPIQGIEGGDDGDNA
jgi:hypothetical protein